MSWRFPNRTPKAGNVLDAQDLNDAFVPYVDEEDGHLGEQNFNSSLRSDLFRETDLQQSICMRAVSVSVLADASDSPLGAGEAGAPAGGGSAPLGAQQIPATGTWVPLTALTHTFTTAGGMLYILASMQLGVTFPIATGGPPQRLTSGSNICTMRVGLRVDGAVYPILTQGDQDSYDEGDYMEMGYGGWCIGAEVDGCVPITPGSHTVDVVMSAHTIDGRIFANTTEVRGEVLNAEMILVEIW